MNELGQFVEDEDALESFEEKDHHHSSIYIMNDKLQVRFCAIFKYIFLTTSFHGLHNARLFLFRRVRWDGCLDG